MENKQRIPAEPRPNLREPASADSQRAIISETQAPRSSSARDPHAPLQLHDGESLCRMDQEIHLFSQQTPSGGDG